MSTVTTLPVFGTFCTPGNTAAGNTAFVMGIPPYPGPAGSPPFLYSDTQGQNHAPNWTSPAGAFTHVTTMSVLAGSTARAQTAGLTIARPKNWTTISADAAGAQAVINITADPGIFTTNYRYPLPGVNPSSAGLYVYPGAIADDGIDAGDWVCYQLPDGTWFFDKVSSVATLAITMTTNVPTGGAKKGAPFFMFEVPNTDKDPATGQLDPSFCTIVSVQNVFQDNVVGICTALHKGDPLMFFDANATNADSLNFIAGFYSPY